MTDLTRAATLSHYPEFAASQGLDGAAQLQAAGLSIAYLAQPDAYIPYRQFVQLLHQSSAASGNALFGLELGLRQGIDQLGSLAYLIRNSGTVRAALDSLIRFYHLHSGSARLSLRQQDEVAWLGYQLTPEVGVPRQAIELALGVGLCLMRSLCGPAWRPQQVLLRSAAEAAPGHYLRLLGLTPQFNAEESGIRFAAACLQQPLSEADPQLHRLMRQQLQTLDSLHRDALPQWVTQQIRRLLPQGTATLEQVARSLALSPRSLQRYLAAEGGSFQQLLEQSRRQLAEQYLRDSPLQVTQLAALLGYAELSSFSRAFRRWFGLSPQQWLRRQPAVKRQRRLRG